MRPFLFLILLVACRSAEPAFDNSAASEVAEADETFSSLSKTRSTRDAFLAYLDEKSFLFRPDSVNGTKFWSENPDLGDLLLWQPELATASNDGELGFTTGPYILQPSRVVDSVKHFGHYFTIWRKRKEGWKVVMDLGLAHEEVPFPEKSELIPPGPGDCSSNAIEEETKFLALHRRDSSRAYTPFVTNDTRVFRPRSLPVSATGLEEYFNSSRMRFDFIYRGGYTSQRCDVGYVYGDVTVELTETGRKVPLHYVRVWRHEADGKWKILFDFVGG